MKNKFRKISSIIMCLAIVLASVAMAFAGEADTLVDQYTTLLQEKYGEDLISGETVEASDDMVAAIDAANNVFSAGSTIAVEYGTFFGGFGAGKEINIQNTNFDDVLALAGQYITAREVQVGSSAFLAGLNINLETFYTYGNLMVAGQDIVLGKLTNTKTAYVVAKNIEYYGLADSARLHANDKVIFGGTVFGDITINANEVEILDSAVVYGKLSVVAKEEPVVPSSAQIGEYEFTKIIKEDTEKVKQVVELNSSFASKAKITIYMILSMTICTLVLCWLKPLFVDNCVVLVKSHAVKVFVTGLVACILLPIASVILVTTIIGIPLALIMMTLYVSIGIFSMVFAGAALGRIIFPKMKGLYASVLGVIIVQVAIQIPYLGALVVFASVLFGFGSVSQLLWQTRLRKEKKEKNEKDI